MPQTPEQRAEKRFPASPQRHAWIIYEQQACATTIREEVEPLEAENAKLRALVQRLVNVVKEAHTQSQASGLHFSKLDFERSNAQILVRHYATALAVAKEQGFVPTNSEDNG